MKMNKMIIKKISINNNKITQEKNKKKKNLNKLIIIKHKINNVYHFLNFNKLSKIFKI